MKKTSYVTIAERRIVMATIVITVLVSQIAGYLASNFLSKQFMGETNGVCFFDRLLHITLGCLLDKIFAGALYVVSLIVFSALVLAIIFKIFKLKF